MNPDNVSLFYNPLLTLNINVAVKCGSMFLFKKCIQSKYLVQRSWRCSRTWFLQPPWNEFLLLRKCNKNNTKLLQTVCVPYQYIDVLYATKMLEEVFCVFSQSVIYRIALERQTCGPFSKTTLQYVYHGNDISNEKKTLLDYYLLYLYI